MSGKHLFHNVDDLVFKSLRGQISSNPSLSLIPSDNVIFDTNHSRKKVSIISGGGAGHDPAWSGYVGKNMLAAAALGDIFASPRARQVESAIKSVPSDEGTLLVITNYTGDCLHFGMACEKANAAGDQLGRVAVMACGDDASVGKKSNGLVGRRGLPGQILVLKVLGAAAEDGRSFDYIEKLGNSLKDQLVSIATTLDHCHVPGRKDHSQIDSNTLEIGTGPHNEPVLSPQPDPEDLIHTLVDYLIDESDLERGYVKFSHDDEVAVVVNNFGGMSVLEMGALTDLFLNQLPSRINPVRTYTGMLETSLNAPAFSLTLLNITAAAKTANVEVKQILVYLDIPTDTVWEGFAGAQKARRSRKDQISPSPLSGVSQVYTKGDVKLDPVLLERSLRTGCKRVINAEPDITKWDTLMGDGDCGETFKSGCLEILYVLDKGIATTGSVISILREVANITETKMGGTFGAILSIYFNAFTSELSKTQNLFTSPAQACISLEKHTSARVGDRTIMDVLIPFAQTLKDTNSLAQAVGAARKGAESTKFLAPVLGRATYVERKDGKELPPDPGAWGAMELVSGLLEGYTSI